VDYIVASTIESGIKYAVQNFEPRIRLISVQALPDYDNNGYTIRIDYSINNATDNRISVFQFFLERIR